SVATYFSHVMSAIGGNTAGPGDAVVNVYINHEKKFAFVEMRSVEEASNAMALDGIIFEGAQVKVRRPSNYNPSLAATLGPSQPNPNLNQEAQVRKLLESFMDLRGFDLVKDRETSNSKGYAFCVYQDHDLSVIDIVCAAINGIKIGDRTLIIKRANQGQTQPKWRVYCYIHNYKLRCRLMLQPAPIGPPPTKVLSLMQVATEEELVNDEDYEDIMENMKIECGKFGKPFTIKNLLLKLRQKHSLASLYIYI
ncbi:splicing factor U2af large subunit B isoform X3, partial [Tanacetum coccineum]